jgi:hypothetical protein
MMTLDELIKTLQEMRAHASGDAPTLIFGREITAKHITQVEEVTIEGLDMPGILLSY